MWNIPVVLFPACANAFSSSADGITFMMLMNSSSTKFLIEEQLIGAPAIKSADVIPISMVMLFVNLVVKLAKSEKQTSSNHIKLS